MHGIARFHASGSTLRHDVVQLSRRGGALSGVSGERREAEIRRRLEETGFVETRQLAVDLAVDSSTIRRDLDRLARAGVVRRTHGGASFGRPTPPGLAAALASATSYDVPYRLREREQVDAKLAIGERAAAYVRDGDSVVLDSGSTTYAVACALGVRHGLSVVTNDVHIAHHLASLGQVRLLVTGGQLLGTVFTLVGPVALDTLSGLRVDWAFLGADAIDVDAGVTNRNTLEVPLKCAMLAAAARRVLVADSTKFGRRAVAAVCAVDAFDTIVTDEGIDARAAAAYGERLVRVRPTGRTVDASPRDPRSER